MKRISPMVVIALVCFSVPVRAATDAEKIRDLEARLAAQETLIRALAERLDGLTKPTSETVATVTKPVALAATKIPEITTGDGVTIKPRGKLQIEALLANSGDGATPTGTQLRRFQIGAEGKLGGGFRYSAEAAFAGGRLSLEDVLLAYQAGPGNEIVVGNFKPPITADSMTSDNHTLLLERSAYADLFAPGRRIGIGYNHFGKNWGVRTSLSGERDDSALDGNRQEAMVIAGRVHANVLGDGSDVLHLAGSTYYTRSSSTERTFSFSQKPEANRALATLSTGNFVARSGMFYGSEAAYGSGAFLLQAEGGTLKFDGSVGNDPRFWGWAAQASLRLTGEARVYDPKSGVFGRIVPLHPVGDSGFGAVELGARFGQVDLTDEHVTGGRMTTVGAIINWYPVTHTRFSANIIRAKTELAGIDDQEQTLVTVRAAVDW